MKVWVLPKIIRNEIIQANSVTGALRQDYSERFFYTVIIAKIQYLLLQKTAKTSFLGFI